MLTATCDFRLSVLLVRPLSTRNVSPIRAEAASPLLRSCCLHDVGVSRLISLVFCMNACHFALLSAETWPRRLDCALKKKRLVPSVLPFSAHLSLSFVRSNTSCLAQLALERASESKARSARAAAWRGLALLAILRSSAIIVAVTCVVCMRSSRS